VILKYYFPTKGRGQTCLWICRRIIGLGSQNDDYHRLIITSERIIVTCWLIYNKHVYGFVEELLGWDHKMMTTTE